MTFQQAMSNVAEDMPDPIGREFSRTIREIQLGSSVDTALERMSERVKSLDLTLTVSAIQIQRQVGGMLALINPEYMMIFFNTRTGNIMLFVAGGMEILGFLIIRKIVDIKY